MSGTTHSRRSAWVLASIVLALAIAAGLLMDLRPGTDTAVLSASSEETRESADIAVASPLETPPAPIDTDAYEAAVEARLTELRQKIQRLEEDVATLQEQRKRIDDELVRLADRSTREPVSATTSPPPVEAAPAVDRAGLDESLGQLGALASERGHVIALGESELSFKVGRAEFASVTPGVLEEIAEVLKRYEHMRARIEGHSDSKGNTRQNQQLTRDRARLVRDVFTEAGIDPERIQAEGLGGIRPITDNRTIAARERNRRIEIYLIEP